MIDLSNRLEPHLGEIGSNCTKTEGNDEDRTTGDTIYRQDAIDALDKHIDTFDAIDTNYLCGLRTAMSFLKEMPSTQPEEVVPHKNYKYLSDYWCECGWHLGKKGDVKYCSNCGRKVKWNG